MFAKTQQGFPVNLAGRHANLLRLLDELMFSDRPDRLGFTSDVMVELFALKNHHDRLYPRFVANQFDPFAAVDRVDEEGSAAAKAPRRAAGTRAATPDPRLLPRPRRPLQRTPAGRKSIAWTSCAPC